MTTAVIIEDEIHAQELLKKYLEKYCNIKVIGTANTAALGIELILNCSPQIVFLDISLPDNDGFEILRVLHPIDFEFIIITAFNQYAINAIRMNTVDYLLKPVDIGELRVAVSKAKDRLTNKSDRTNLQILIDNFNKQISNKRIAIPNGHSYYYEEISNIIRLHAQGRYTELFLCSGKKHMVTRNLGEFEKQLSQFHFLRVHHSHLVNPDYISSYQKNDGGYLVMKDNSIVEVSRRNKNLLLKYLNE